MTPQPDDRRSTGFTTPVRRDPAPPAGAAPAPSVEAGARCPRPHCGGLIVLRDVLTTEGGLKERYCTACSRAYGAEFDVVYDPPRLALTMAQEAALDAVCSSVARSGSSRSSRGLPLDGDTSDILFPRSILDPVDRCITFQDESLPSEPLDRP